MTACVCFAARLIRQIGRLDQNFAYQHTLDTAFDMSNHQVTAVCCCSLSSYVPNSVIAKEFWVPVYLSHIRYWGVLRPGMASSVIV